MSNENTGRLFIYGEHSEIREASNDEIVTAAREIMNRKIRRGTPMAPDSSPIGLKEAPSPETEASA